MNFIMANSLGTGIACGIWTGLAAYFGARYPELIAIWVGFAGCTSYFVAGTGRNGFIRSLTSNYVGIAIGCTIIALGSVSDGILFSAIVTGFFSFVIAYITHFDITKFATCTFIGGFSAFATGGNWKMLLICFFLGNILGASCDVLGQWFVKMFVSKEKVGKDWVALDFLER